MTEAEVLKIKNKITTILQTNSGIAPSVINSLLPTSVKSLQGKLYEAYILALICENLVTRENCTIKLVQGANPILKQKGSPINRNYPYFEVSKNGYLFGELFTDTYFTTLSYSLKATLNNPVRGDYHELDIAMIMPGKNSYPKHDEIMLAVECKNTSVKKHIIREVLGFRRELSFFKGLNYPTHFQNWPANSIASSPGSVHMLYCSDRAVNNYQSNCLRFGILTEYFKMN